MAGRSVGGVDGATSARANSGSGGGGTCSGNPGNGASGIVVVCFTIGGNTPKPPESPSVEGGERIDFEKDMTDNRNFRVYVTDVP